NPLFSLVVDRFATVERFGELSVSCATPEGLILLKLYALPSLYRQGNIQRANLYESDVAALIFAANPNMDALLAELSPHVSNSDLNELRKIINEVHLRARRFTGSP